MVEPRVSVQRRREHLRELAARLPRRRIQSASRDRGAGDGLQSRGPRFVRGRPEDASGSTAGCALNVAAFYVKYTDLQLPSVFVDSDGSVTFPPLNAGKAHMDGVELEFQAQVCAAASRVDGSVGYLGFQYDDLGQRRSGLHPRHARTDAGAAEAERARGAVPECRPLRAPEWTANLGAAIHSAARGSRQPHVPRGRLVPVARVLFRRTTSSARASRRTRSWMRASAGRRRTTRWRVMLSGTNLTDELYLNGALDFFESLGQNEGAYGRPRNGPFRCGETSRRRTEVGSGD